VGNFQNLATKKKVGLMNLTKDFLGIKKKKSPYFVKKSLEVARFKQYARAGR
jgi:hypothetical protein